MEDKKQINLYFAILVSSIPLIISITNSLLLRFAGFGYILNPVFSLISIEIVIFGAVYPLITLRANTNNYLLRHICFFAIFCAAIVPLYFSPFYLSIPFSMLALAGISAKINIGAILYLTLCYLSIRYILRINFKSYAYIRVLFFLVIYSYLVSSFIDYNFFSYTDSFNKKAFLIFFIGSVLSLEIENNRLNVIKAFLFQSLLILLTFLSLFLWKNFSVNNGLQSKMRVTSAVQIKIDLKNLKEFEKEENQEKLKNFLSSSKLWKVNSALPLNATLRKKKGELYVVTSRYSFGGESTSLFAELTIKDQKRKRYNFGSFINKDTFQSVDANESSIDALLLSSKYANLTKIKEINLIIKTKNIELVIIEKAKEQNGKSVNEFLSKFRNDLNFVLNNNTNQIISSNAEKDLQDNCFYYSPINNRNIDVFGYLNPKEAGSIGMAINNKQSGYSKEWIGWSDIESQKFYFNLSNYFNSDEEVSKVEIRFYAEKDNKNNYSNNYKIILECERR